METEGAYRNFALFRDMNEEQIRRFMAAGFRFKYSAGSSLVSRDDGGETFFLILSGSAKVVLTNARNEAVNLSLVQAGDFFGELAMLGQQPQRTADVIAITDMEVVTVQKQEFLRSLHQMPILAINIASVLGERLRTTAERLVIQTLPEDIRIAEVILQMSKKGRIYVEDGPILLPSLSLQEWSLFCDAPRTAFMSVMERLKELGALEWQCQRIVVKDPGLLKRYAEENRPEGSADALMLQ